MKDRVNFILENHVQAAKLTYVDSNCTYLQDEKLYSGYVLHNFNQKYRFNRFENGEYFGEEWIFDSTVYVMNCDSILKNLKEFRVRSETDENRMIVTSYYDYLSNKIHEKYVDYRYLCAKREPEGEAFEVIFGGDIVRKLPYESFYENGNRKEVSNGDLYDSGELITYYSNGEVEMYTRVKKFNEDALLKEFDENGKCVYRMKYRNGKLRGIYVITGGKMILSSSARRQLKKNKKFH